MMSKTVIITGSQGNLGESVTTKFEQEGYKVIGTVSPGKSTETSSQNVIYKEVDLLNAEEAKGLASEAVNGSGSIHAIVCLVGGFGMSDLLGSDKEQVDKMINLNFYTAFNTVKSFLELTKEQDSPVNIVLVGAKPAVEKSGVSAVFPYALSKSMVINLAETINSDSRNLNAYATIVAPSVIDTPPNRDSMPDADFSDWVTPKSIADKIHFVCSDAGKDLRGTVLKIYGNS